MRTRLSRRNLFGVIVGAVAATKLPAAGATALLSPPRTGTALRIRLPTNYVEASWANGSNVRFGRGSPAVLGGWEA